MSANSVKLYALSTCVHCRHAKQFLEEFHVPFEFIYVDQLQGEERQQIIAQVKQYNPRVSFPTLVLCDGATVIIGFQREELREALHL